MAVTSLPPPLTPVLPDTRLERAVAPVVDESVLDASIRTAVDGFLQGDRGPLRIEVASADPRFVPAPRTPGHKHRPAQRRHRHGAAGVDAGTPVEAKTALSVRGGDLDRVWRRARAVTADQLAAILPDRAKDLAPAFVASGEAHGVDPLLLVAISKHETGGWTSAAFRRGNAMGVAGKHRVKSFKSPERSIELMARTLADPEGPYKDATTLRDLWRIYAPSPRVGSKASNDPRGLNRSWGPAIAKNLADLELQLGSAPAVAP